KLTGLLVGKCVRAAELRILRRKIKEWRVSGRGGRRRRRMMSNGINLVMTVIGFAVSTMFIVFVCTRLICARIQLSASRRSFPLASRSDLSIVSTDPSLPSNRLLVNLIGIRRRTKVVLLAL
ncbi:hypothetical protein CRG98_050158, partial [Punica granatum]